MKTFKYDPINLEGPGFRLVRLFKASWGEIRCELFDAWLDSDVLIAYEALSCVWSGLDRTHEIQVNGYCHGRPLTASAMGPKRTGSICRLACRYPEV